MTPTGDERRHDRAQRLKPQPLNGRVRARGRRPRREQPAYDAGWYGAAPYDVLKTVSGPGPAGVTYNVEVTSAVNFRGQDRLAGAGSDPGARDPQVTNTQFALTPGVPVAAGQDLPYGTRWSSPRTSLTERLRPTARSSSLRGSRRVAAEGTARHLAEQRGRSFDVENLYGSLQVAKTLSGDPEAIAELEDFEFTVNWTSTSLPSSATRHPAPSLSPVTALQFPRPPSPSRRAPSSPSPRRRRPTFRRAWSGPPPAGRGRKRVGERTGRPRRSPSSEGRTPHDGRADQHG